MQHDLTYPAIQQNKTVKQVAIKVHAITLYNTGNRQLHFMEFPLPGNSTNARSLPAFCHPDDEDWEFHGDKELLA